MGGFLGPPISEGQGPDPGSIIAGVIGSIFNAPGATDLPTVISEALGFTYANTMAGENFLLDAIKGLLKPLTDTIAVIAGSLQHIILDILHGHLKQVLNDIIDLLKKLHDIWAPIIAWLRHLQQIQRQYQLQALRRIVNLIQRARQFLVILKLLHVKWAQRLDGWLLQVEGKLISHVYALFQKQNEVIGWINWALDPTAMIRSQPYFGTFARGMKAVWGAAQAIGLGKLLPQLAPGHGTAPPTKTFVDFYGTSHVGLASGAGYFGETQGVVLFVRNAIRADAGGAQG